MIDILYVAGFPSLCGGTGAELYHQIKVWGQMGVEMHFIPTQKNVHRAELYPEMIERVVTVHEEHGWSVILEGAPIIGFYNEEFLAALPEIWQPDEGLDVRENGKSHYNALKQSVGFTRESSAWNADTTI